MINYLKYIIAYISLAILWFLFILTLCSIFGFYNIDTKPGLIIWGILFGYIYHKYKPMEFRELLEKIGITL